MKRLPHILSGVIVLAMIYALYRTYLIASRFLPLLVLCVAPAGIAAWSNPQ